MSGDKKRPITHDGFDEEETRLLRNFFRDEAHEYLERLISTLLDARKTSLSPDAIDELMRTTHTLKGSAATVGLDDVATVAHDLEDCLAQFKARKRPWSAAAAEHLVETADSLRALVDVTDETSRASVVAQLQVQMAAFRAGATPPVEPPQPPAPQPRRRSPTDTGDRIESGSIPLQEGPVQDRRLFSDRRREDTQVLRVDAARVDQLMNSVGELVFDRTRIERKIADLRRMVRELSDTRAQLRDRVGSDPSLAAIERELGGQIAQLARQTGALLDDADALRRTTHSLQDGLTQVRMSSARALFSRLARSLREATRGTRKRVELVAIGDDTEFDKTVADAVAEPLLQLLRNAVAHGIEDDDEREAVGKPRTGTIRVEARQEGEHVWLEVSDDGAGVDPGRLRDRLVASGRWTREQAAEANDAQILRAIFEPGVSSRESTDALAGRGVGLDAVRESIARLGGDIRVESTRGEGTTFSMRLPVTTAIAQALLFKVAGDVYAVPNVHVVETAHVEASSPSMPRHLRRRGDIIPLVVLHEVLGAPVPTDARRVPAVVIDYAGRRLAITCDKVVGPREIVIKSLGPLLAPLPLYAGGTISGSGKVQLILDAATLVRLAHPESTTGDGPLGAEASAEQAPRVLIVDDSRAVREAVHRMLAGAGYVVDTADDGQHALEMLGQFTYAAVVTDLEMPRLDGFGLLEHIRADDGLAALPALVISSRTARANRERAAELGAKEFIPKPVTRRKLLDALQRVLTRSEPV